MRWLASLLLGLSVVSACRSQPTSPAPAPPSPARVAPASVAPRTTLPPEPVLVEELPWVDPDEPEVGAIAGMIVDATSEPLAGVTVIVSGDEMPAQVAISDEDGSYAIEDLPWGELVVSFYYIDITIERRVQVEDELLEVQQTIDTGTTGAVSFTGCGTSMVNTYIVDGIDTTGLTFDE